MTIHDRKLPCLEYAQPIAERPQAGTLDDLLASIAWLGDNEGYGIKDGCKQTIDKARALFAARAPDPMKVSTAAGILVDFLQTCGGRFSVKFSNLHEDGSHVFDIRGHAEWTLAKVTPSGHVDVQ
jgi:hypothetical protein